MSWARWSSAAILCCAAVCGVRCGGSTHGAPTPADSGTSSGGPGPDAGTPDAGNPGGGADAGNPETDAGTGAPDGGGQSDAGAPGGGTPDAGGGSGGGGPPTALYTLTDLGPILGEGSLPESIDNDGVIVGRTLFQGTPMHFVYDTRNGDIRRVPDPRDGARLFLVRPNGDGAGNFSPPSGGDHAFLWRGGVLKDLGTLGGSFSNPLGMNGRGDVVGMASTAPFEDFYPFLFTDGSMKNLGSLGGRGGKALAVNGSGQVTGNMETDPKCGGCTHAFLFSGGSVRDLGTLGKDPKSPHQTDFSWGTAINEDGQVAGLTSTPDGFAHVYLWDGSKMIDLGTHPHRGVGVPVSLNIHGQMVGSLGEGSGDELAYVVRDGAAHDLNELVDSHPLVLWHAVSINDSGVIVGTGGEPPGQHKRGFIARPR
jgi:probable HAF family extracellular repeat protein